jgi:hypothetical protein
MAPQNPDIFQECPIVADDQQRTVISAQDGLDSLNGVDVQMIGRLVKDQQRRRR